MWWATAGRLAAVDFEITPAWLACNCLNDRRVKMRITP